MTSIAFPSDIEIAQGATLRPITEVAGDLGLDADDIDQYGRFKAKLPVELAQRPARGKLVLVSSINSTPVGEGKSTTMVGLGQALRRLGTNAVVC
ncbi:MAG TPA: formate--tetrahydrofolate ligase, partial [Gemmatimonadales bacterium]